MSSDFNTGKFTLDEIEELKNVLKEACELLGVAARAGDVTHETVAGVIARFALNGTREPHEILRKTMQHFKSET